MVFVDAVVLVVAVVFDFVVAVAVVVVFDSRKFHGRIFHFRSQRKTRTWNLFFQIADFVERFSEFPVFD